MFHEVYYSPYYQRNRHCCLGSNNNNTCPFYRVPILIALLPTKKHDKMELSKHWFFSKRNPHLFWKCCDSSLCLCIGNEPKVAFTKDDDESRSRWLLAVIKAINELGDPRGRMPPLSRSEQISERVFVFDQLSRWRQRAKESQLTNFNGKALLHARRTYVLRLRKPWMMQCGPTFCR